LIILVALKSKLNKLIDFIDNEYVMMLIRDSIVNLTVDIWHNLTRYPYIFRQVSSKEVMESMLATVGIALYM
jgi:hypothetical protein